MAKKKIRTNYDNPIYVDMEKKLNEVEKIIQEEEKKIEEEKKEKEEYLKNIRMLFPDINYDNV